MAKKPQPAPKNFEEALRELERILGEMEGGQIGLEESLGKYERGAFLVQHCRGVLNAAEKQIELLSEAASGGLRTSTLVPSPGDPSAAPSEVSDELDPLTSELP